jgi:hypothetical protein
VLPSARGTEYRQLITDEEAVEANRVRTGVAHI